MDVLYPRCAGLDVHKDVVVACVRIAQPGGQASQDVRSFATTTTDPVARILTPVVPRRSRIVGEAAFYDDGAYMSPRPVSYSSAVFAERRRGRARTAAARGAGHARDPRVRRARYLVRPARLSWPRPAAVPCGRGRSAHSLRPRAGSAGAGCSRCARGDRSRRTLSDRGRAATSGDRPLSPSRNRAYLASQSCPFGFLVIANERSSPVWIGSCICQPRNAS